MAATIRAFLWSLLVGEKQQNLQKLISPCDMGKIFILCLGGECFSFHSQSSSLNDLMKNLEVFLPVVGSLPFLYRSYINEISFLILWEKMKFQKTRVLATKKLVVLTKIIGSNNLFASLDLDTNVKSYDFSSLLSLDGRGGCIPTSVQRQG